MFVVQNGELEVLIWGYYIQMVFSSIVINAIIFREYVGEKSNRVDLGSLREGQRWDEGEINIEIEMDYFQFLSIYFNFFIGQREIFFLVSIFMYFRVRYLILKIIVNFIDFERRLVRDSNFLFVENCQERGSYEIEICLRATFLDKGSFFFFT